MEEEKDEKKAASTDGTTTTTTTMMRSENASELFVGSARRRKTVSRIATLCTTWSCLLLLGCCCRSTGAFVMIPSSSTSVPFVLLDRPAAPPPLPLELGRRIVGHHHRRASGASVLRRWTAATPEASTLIIPALEDASLQSVLSISPHDAPFPRQLKSSVATPYCLHGVVPNTGPLNLAVAQLANVTLQQANEWIALGAVWARLETLTQEELVSLYEESEDDDYLRPVSSSRALYADVQGRGTSSPRKSREENNGDEESEDEGESLDDYIARMEQVRYRRVLQPTTIDAGTDVRIYPTPRRFTHACQQLTPNKLLYEDTTFLVVDKPPMLPTQPDASNYQECCPGCVSNALNGRSLIDVKGRMVERPLLCHRVDAAVGGCVVMSKDRHGQKVFAALQRDRKIRKVYLAITDTPVPLGQHVHWMWAPQTNVRGKRGGPPCQLVKHQPPESRRKAREFWSRCVLEVVESKPIRVWEEDDKTPSPSGPPFRYQSVIRLVTGRKHQVRAQLASLGCPIWRDTLYGPMSGLTLDDLEPTTTTTTSSLSSSSSQQVEEQLVPSREDLLDRALQQCRVPTEPIGLQAHAIAFGGVTAVARPPWWSRAGSGSGAGGSSTTANRSESEAKSG